MDKALAEHAPARGKPLGVSLLLAFLMFLLTAFMFVGPRLSPGGKLNLPPNEAVAMGITLFSAAVLFFRMIRTGRTDRYRAIFFVAFAVLFVVEFTAQLIELRGTTELSRTEMLEGRTPFCHIVIPQALIPAALTRTIIFPGSMLEGFAAVGSMLVLWIAVTLAFGRGWCAWGCFYGGMDDGFSRIRKTVLDTHIHRPVFDALVGQFSEGFIQVDWRSRTGFMPPVVTEEITFGPGPGPDFRIAFDSRTLKVTEFKALSPAVLGVEGVYPLHKGAAARIRLRRLK